MNIDQLKKIYFTASKQGATEEHTISSLSKRILCSPEDCHDLIASGELQPLEEASEDGKKLTFRSEDCDLIRNHIVNSVTDETAKGSPHNPEFAAARAMTLLQRKVADSVLLFERNARLIRLSSVRPEIRFGIGMDLVGDVAKKFLGDAAGAAVAGKIGGALASPIVRQGLQGAGIGALGGAGASLVHNVIDQNPQDHKSVLGGALEGGVAGGAIGAGSAALKQGWPTGPAAGLGQSGSYSKPSPFNTEEISAVPAGSTPRSSAQSPTPSTTDLPGMDAPNTPGSSPSYSSGSQGSPFNQNDPLGGPSPSRPMEPHGVIALQAEPQPSPGLLFGSWVRERHHDPSSYRHSPWRKFHGWANFMNSEPLEIPLFYRQQMEALAYVSNKSRQQVLNAVLAKALPSPATDPENLLELAFSLQQPGDDIPSLAARFREVRDAEQIPMDDHSVMLSIESLCGIISPEERALFEEAAAIFSTGKVLPVQKTTEELASEYDAMQEDRAGDEWKHS